MGQNRLASILSEGKLEKRGKTDNWFYSAAMPLKERVIFLNNHFSFVKIVQCSNMSVTKVKSFSAESGRKKRTNLFYIPLSSVNFFGFCCRLICNIRTDQNNLPTSLHHLRQAEKKSVFCAVSKQVVCWLLRPSSVNEEHHLLFLV